MRVDYLQGVVDRLTELGRDELPGYELVKIGSDKTGVPTPTRESGPVVSAGAVGVATNPNTLPITNQSSIPQPVQDEFQGQDSDTTIANNITNGDLAVLSKTVNLLTQLKLQKDEEAVMLLQTQVAQQGEVQQQQQQQPQQPQQQQQQQQQQPLLSIGNTGA